ncbi:MAG: hypothetical protein FWE33_04645 [Defluviitaleaceae bacterium]|nr:hypothetical protein [Defluviitaleaceae bacterium]
MDKRVFECGKVYWYVADFWETFVCAPVRIEGRRIVIVNELVGRGGYKPQERLFYENYDIKRLFKSKRKAMKVARELKKGVESICG